MRRIEQQDADEQKYLHAQTIPKRGTGFQPVENMAKMAMPLDQASPSLRDEAATPPAEKKGDLKKQSQFAPAENDAKSFLKGDYDNKPAGGAEENKAKQSQTKPISRSRADQRSEKKQVPGTLPSLSSSLSTSIRHSGFPLSRE